jgi:hypothetical protein
MLGVYPQIKEKKGKGEKEKKIKKNTNIMKKKY